MAKKLNPNIRKKVLEHLDSIVQDEAVGVSQRLEAARIILVTDGNRRPTGEIHERATAYLLAVVSGPDRSLGLAAADALLSYDPPRGAGEPKIVDRW